MAYVKSTIASCSLLLWDNRTNQWSPYYDSMKELNIPGFTFSDALYGNIFV